MNKLIVNNVNIEHATNKNSINVTCPNCKKPANLDISGCDGFPSVHIECAKCDKLFGVVVV